MQNTPTPAFQGNFASQDFSLLRDSCGSSTENCADLREMSFFPLKWPTSIAEICGDDESAQKLRRKTSTSWLVKFPARLPDTYRIRLVRKQNEA